MLIWLLVSYLIATVNDKFDKIELVITDNSRTKIINYGHSGIIQNLRRYAP